MTSNVSHADIFISGRESHLEEGPLLHPFQNGIHALPVLLLQPDGPAPFDLSLTLLLCIHRTSQLDDSAMARLWAVEVVVLP